METTPPSPSPPLTLASPTSMEFYDFHDKMRNPIPLDLVRSINSFIVSSFVYPANPENDGKKVQYFFMTMEGALRDHPLWAGASDKEIDCAMEGLEKHVMKKLFSRTFACSAEDSKIDREIAEKISLLQTFLRPEHLDIPAILRNEASWLLAEKELQKINSFKGPREKLLCIMNCCRVINNLLLNASISENHVLAGADHFLSLLIYITIKANPPQLHSNLIFIQLYRRQAKLVSEAANYFTNLFSAKLFIAHLDARSLSINEIEFEENMQAARGANKIAHDKPDRVVEEMAAMRCDQYGEDALKEGMGGGGGHDPFNIFSSFFGGSRFGGGSSNRGRRQRRGEDVVHPLKVSLENLYLGTTKKLSLSRDVLCSKCNGKGSSESGASMTCPGCRGTGVKVTIRPLGPSLIEQMEQCCNDCKGTGETINKKDRCPQCKGEKVVPEKKVLEVLVEMGMQNGQKITFPGEADEALDTVTRDVVFILQQMEHPKFKRNGDDLFVEHTLSLTEAPCGFQFVLTHLDGRRLLIKSKPGEVVKPYSFKAINDEGMPIYQRPFMKGKLYIHFTVDFPESLSPEQIGAPQKVLPQKLASQLTKMELDECEKTTLHDVNIDIFI